MADQISFTINLAPGVMTELSNGGYSLCMSNVVGKLSGNVATVALSPTGEHGEAPDVTIIFVADDNPAFTAINKFSWNVTYSIAATKTPWEDGVLVEGQSQIVPIPLGSRYELGEWSAPPKVTTGVAGKLGFSTTKYNASPIVYLDKVAANKNTISPAPIYVAPKQVLFPGEDVLTPKVAVIIYFAQDIVTSTMTANTSSMKVNIDLTNQLTGQVWALGDDHKWTKQA
ncbi:hypothetical protein H0H81_007307 [Sphagnurus paluster]|uniref:Uncharacterized protein n=1 Tax=Sphagnurus paluster TaxID=117069 RepID=A0A9P7FSU4_9AGAR|nr:hypothetical protein H0H81_007307 [Sphagnurus paluster]